MILKIISFLPNNLTILKKKFPKPILKISLTKSKIPILNLIVFKTILKQPISRRFSKKIFKKYYHLSLLLTMLELVLIRINRLLILIQFIKRVFNPTQLIMIIENPKMLFNNDWKSFEILILISTLSILSLAQLFKMIINLNNLQIRVLKKLFWKNKNCKKLPLN